MDSTPDHKLVDYTYVVISGLALFGFVLLVTAVLVSRHTTLMNQQRDSSFGQALEDRIRPFGDVMISGQVATVDGRDVVESVTAAASAGSSQTAEVSTTTTAGFTTGEEVYNSACTVCHGLGIAGAPKMGDAAQWAARIDTGMETLYEHAIKGYTGSAGVMPAKGGRMDLSDELVASSVDYMVEQSQ